MEFNVNLGLKRQVVAVKSEGAIKKGEVYTVSNIDVGHSCTMLWIDGREYNSVLFNEIENSPLIKAVSKAKEGATMRVIARFCNLKDIKLFLWQHPVTISEEKLSLLKVGDVLTLGRLKDCDICCDANDIPFTRAVSRMHCFVYRETEKTYKLIDCSSFGTEVCL